MKKYNYSSRPNIFSSNGIAATSHPLATEEAISILKMGGKKKAVYGTTIGIILGMFFIPPFGALIGICLPGVYFPCLFLVVSIA